MSLSDHRILITGSNGFIGKNLVVRLKELSNIKVSTFVRGDRPEMLPEILAQVDSVVHLAGENRPFDESLYSIVNTGLTEILCKAIEQEYVSTGRRVPLVFASTTQVFNDNSYGRSKLLAEQALRRLSKASDNPCTVFRFPGVFGKWCKPNYNSVVATFCYNIARNFPIRIDDPENSVKLVFVEDVIDGILNALEMPEAGYRHLSIQPEYNITVGEIASQIRSFSNCRHTLISERVGTGLLRAFYATYISYLPNQMFSYMLPQHRDSRGVFVEMLKTPDCGQFSYFTANPGITRGGHYHHIKTEKFLVISGKAHFRFRHLLTDELVELRTSGMKPQVVDTIPGWAHDITNVGEDELIVMLWANENFDPKNPDTVERKIS